MSSDDLFPKLREADDGTYVKFSSERNEFSLHILACSNPECICSDGLLSFVEVTEQGRRVPGGKAFTVNVDFETWHETRTTQRPAAIQSLVDELRGPAGEQARNWIGEGLRRSKETKNRIHEYRITPKDVTDGILVSYADIVSDEGGILGGGKLCSFAVTHKQIQYGVEDLYCPKPDCKCKEVQFVIWGPDEPDPDGKLPALFAFRGSMTLRGRIEIDKTRKLNKKQARAVMKALRDQIPELLDLVKERYAAVKEIGRRSLADAPSPSPRPERTAKPRKAETTKRGRPGRNSPCPCGSGKKFKKCCGK